VVELNKERFEVLLEEMRSNFKLVFEKFDIIDGKFDAIDNKFDAIDRRFDLVDRRFDLVDRRFDLMDRKIDNVHDSLKREIKTSNTILDYKIEEHLRVAHAS